MEPLHSVFGSSWSHDVWVRTLAFTMAVFAAGVVTLLVGMSILGRSKAGAVLALLIVLLLLVSTFSGVFFMPVQYVAGASGITISRLGPDIRIPLSNMTGVRAARPAEVFSCTYRLWASDGIFGYYGEYRGGPLRRFASCVTRTDRLVVIARRKGEPVVISPDDRQRFLDSLGSLLSQRGPAKVSGRRSANAEPAE